MKLPLVLTSAALAGCSSMPDPCKPMFIVPTLTSLAITGAVLAGCAALPSNTNNATATTAVVEANSALAVDKEIPPMSRQEVIHGISECEKANMRPYVITTRRKVNNQLIPAVVEITCLPISK
jgi:hypothetical protein